MNALDKSLFFKGFRSTLSETFGQEEADRIWARAGQEHEALKATHPGLDKDSAMLILPAVALYRTKPECLPLLQAYAEKLGRRLGKMVHAVTCIPGIPELLWKNMPKLMRQMSSAEKGYQRHIVSETKALVGVDILVCPLHQAAQRLGAPEVAKVVCAMDKACMTGFRHIEYTRTTAIGEGDACCDYRLRYDKTKK